MRRLGTLFIAASLALAGCELLDAAKLAAPANHGMVPISDNLWVEAAADAAVRERLRAAWSRAECAIGAAYGSVQTRPVAHACVTEDCYEHFGGRGSRAKVYGDRILLSPRGLSWHFLAHEWAHAEIRNRLGFRAWLRLPQWFDEGLAVAVSAAPEHSEAHWQWLIAAGVARPTPEELRTLASRRQWLAAVRRYGETQNAERRAGGEPEVRPVYTAAGHEVRPRLAAAGSAGLLHLIDRLNGGEDFESGYGALPAAPRAVAAVPPARACH